RRTPRPCCEDWNACAVPANPVVIVAGRVCLATRLTAVTASPSEPLGRRLNEIVTDGSCPECATLSGPTPRSNPATADRGTRVPCAPGTYSFASAVSSSWSRGRTSRSTQYSLLLV